MIKIDFLKQKMNLLFRNLVKCLDEKSREAGMEISPEKTKIMTTRSEGLSSDIFINGSKLEVVHKL